ncbi:MAG: type II secretion system F family protein [Thiobacillaceae bacterium]|jgi:type IV pilus assembly protein PilC
MATAVVKDATFLWEGMDKRGKKIKGQMLAGGEAVVTAQLRRQGIAVTKVRKQSTLFSSTQKITEKDIALFTRQLATMMKAGVPLLQSFDIVAKGNANPSVQRLLAEVKADIEKGSSMAQAFGRHPRIFDALYCNLVNAGEQAGILDAVLDRLATYKEKIVAIKGKIKSALFYPAAVIVVAFIVTAVIMIFVIPAFKELFTSFGADLPAPTLLIMKISDFFVKWWWAIFGVLIGGTVAFMKAWKRSKPIQAFMDRLMLRLPIFGPVIEKATLARWTRTLSTMFAAGVPLVEALDSVAGAAGNHVFEEATYRIRGDVATGTSLTTAMQSTGKFPNMVMQMTAIGEESGALDSMLSKVADFYEQEVDDAVDSIASLIEPLIMVVLGVLIGGMVIAMYLPIFKMGQAV